MSFTSKTQQQAIELLRARLDPKHPMFAGSEQVAAALTGDAKVYFDTWVVPVLDFLLNGEQWHGQAYHIRNDHATATARVARLAKMRANHEASKS